MSRSRLDLRSLPPSLSITHRAENLWRELFKISVMLVGIMFYLVHLAENNFVNTTFGVQFPKMDDISGTIRSRYVEVALGTSRSLWVRLVTLVERALHVELSVRMFGGIRAVSMHCRLCNSLQFTE